MNERMRSPENIQRGPDMHDANVHQPLGSMMSALKVNRSQFGSLTRRATMRPHSSATPEQNESLDDGQRYASIDVPRTHTPAEKAILVEGRETRQRDRNENTHIEHVLQQKQGLLVLRGDQQALLQQDTAGEGRGRGGERRNVDCRCDSFI